MLQRVDVRLESINIMVGPNASGKSTLLDVFAFLQSALNDDVESAVNQRGALNETVWMRTDIDDGFEIAVKMNIPDQLSNEYGALRYELSVSLNKDAGLFIDTENLILIPSDLPDSQSARLSGETINDSKRITAPLHGRLPKGHKKIVYRSDKGSSVFQSEINSWKISFLLSSLKLSLSGIPEDRRRFPLALWFRDALKEQVKIIQLESSKLRDFCPAGAKTSYQTDGSNLPQVINRLKEIYEQRFN